MKKKKYIREGGICQFFDNYSKDGVHIEGQELVKRIFEEKEKNSKDDSYSSYIPSCENYPIKDVYEEKQVPFNRNYKIYGKED